jgi:hypothetical protein
MFWRKKTNKAAESGSRLEVSAAEPLPDYQKLGDQLKVSVESQEVLKDFFCGLFQKFRCVPLAHHD